MGHLVVGSSKNYLTSEEEKLRRQKKVPKPRKNAQLDSKKSSLLSKLNPDRFHLYLGKKTIRKVDITKET